MVESSRYKSYQNDGADSYRGNRSIYNDYRDKLGRGGIRNSDGGRALYFNIGGRAARSGGKIMKKLFISQPMKGKSDEEILREREKAVSDAQSFFKEPVEVIDSFFQSAPVGAKPLWFLGKSLELLSDADIAYFAKGWRDARGCRLEHDAAKAYGITAICVEEEA